MAGDEKSNDGAAADVSGSTGSDGRGAGGRQECQQANVKAGSTAPSVSASAIPNGVRGGPGQYSRFRFKICQDVLTGDWFDRRPILGYIGGEDDFFRALVKSLGQKYELRTCCQHAEVDYILASAEGLAADGARAGELTEWVRESGLGKKFFLLTGAPGFEGFDCREFVFDMAQGVHGLRLIHWDRNAVNSIDKLINLDRSVVLSDFTIKASISGDVISSEVVLGKSLEGLRGRITYQFKVRQEDETLFDSGTVEFPVFDYRTERQGVFLVRGTVACGRYSYARKSNSVRYYHDGTLEMVDRILSEPPFYCQAPVRISSDDPFQDVMVHVARGGRDLGDAAAVEGMSLQWEDSFGDRRVRFYSEKAESRDGRTVAVSGIVGDGGSGCFVRVAAGDGRVDMTRDSCAFGQLFMYESAEDTVISNHYYTLVRALSYAGIPLSVNAAKVEMTLSVVKVMVMQQNDFSQMDIDGIFQVTSDSSISIVEGDVVRVRSPVGEILDKDAGMTYQEYLSLLDKASTGVTDAVKAAAAEHKPLLFDLTGGLDSRALFAALTNTDVPRDDINIHSWGDMDSEDVRIALEINSMYGYGYGESTIARSEDEFSFNDNYWRNKLMGRIYSTFGNPFRHVNRTYRISGGVGGAFTRPEYGRRLFWTRAEYAGDPREVADCVWQDQVAVHVITDSSSAEKTFLDLMSEEIGRTQGTSLIESYGLNYVYFRNVYHFNPETYYDHRDCWLYPLQNITLFELNHRTHDVFSSHRVEIELINNLNPVLSPMRTSNKWGKEDYRNVKDQLVNRYLKCYSVRPDTEGAERRLSARRENLYSKESEPKRKKTPELEIAVLVNRIRILSRLEGGRYRHVSESLLLTLARERGDRQVVNSIYNRVSSALDQIHIASGFDRSMLLLDAGGLYASNPKASVDEIKALDAAAKRTGQDPDLEHDEFPGVTYWGWKSGQSDNGIDQFTERISKGDLSRPSFALFGSCVVRDSLAISGMEDYCNINGYYSFVSPLVFGFGSVERPPVEDSDKWRARCHALDMDKGLLARLQSKKSDYLLLDVADVRYGLLTYENAELRTTVTDSRLNTMNSEMMKSMFPDGPASSIDPVSLSEQELEAMMGPFIEAVGEAYDSGRIILVVPQRAKKYLGLDGLVKRFDVGTNTVNRLIRTASRILVERLGLTRVISVPESAVAYEGHKWGLDRLHYLDEMYRYIGESILGYVKDDYDNARPVRPAPETDPSEGRSGYGPVNPSAGGRQGVRAHRRRESVGGGACVGNPSSRSHVRKRPGSAGFQLPVRRGSCPKISFPHSSRSQVWESS